MKYKSILETKGKLADARANPHMLHTYGYMLNQGEMILINFYFIFLHLPFKNVYLEFVAYHEIKSNHIPLSETFGLRALRSDLGLLLLLSCEIHPRWTTCNESYQINERDKPYHFSPTN